MAAAARRFRELHTSGCFLLPNPWDVGGARLLEQLGYVALASSSAGLAFSLGRPDDGDALHVDEVVSHLAALVAGTSLPLNADFQSGYGATAEEVARQVRRCAETGVAGLSIEDAHAELPNTLHDLPDALERLRAARQAIDAVDSEIVLTARAECFLVGEKRLDEVLRRLEAYADAGADCLYAPGLETLEQIETVVQAMAPKPVNVLITGAAPWRLDELAERGVRRVSLGSALSRVAWGAVLEFSRELLQSGDFSGLSRAASFAELNERFG